MVPGDVHRKNGGLLHQLGIELLATEAGLRGVKRRVEQTDARRLCEDDRVDAGHGLSDGERFRQGQIPQRAKRSRISLSFSVICRR